MLDLYKNIQKYRKDNHMTQEQLAHRMGYSDKSMISKIERGKVDLPQSQIVRFAKIFHVDPGTLMGDTEETKITKTLQHAMNMAASSVRPVPILGEICCGDGIFTEQNFDGYFYIDKSVSADYCLKARGDSMKDAGINAGDLVMIRKTPEFEDGKIYAVHKNGEQLASLKKVYKSDNHHLMLVACNSAYPPEQVDAQDIYLIGRCVGVYKNL